MTIVYTKQVEVILHYITLTGYDIVNDTKRQEVITSP